jgi:hypothetical protein
VGGRLVSETETTGHAHRVTGHPQPADTGAHCATRQRKNTTMTAHTGGTVDLSWVEQTQTVDATDRTVVQAIEANPGWRLLHVGTGNGGQTTLTYGWPYPQSGRGGTDG